MHSALKVCDLKEWKMRIEKTAHTPFNTDTVCKQRQNSSSCISKFSKSNGSRRIYAIFLISMQFMIIATMSAKG
jgi:hypothetical protein